MKQRKNLRRIPKRTVKSFATTVTSLVMSNKTANFPRSIRNTQITVRKKQWQPPRVTVMDQAQKKIENRENSKSLSNGQGRKFVK